uniref:CUB domain-containing protein n=1 Tax=Caenorhabditis japonica TaxID=281687 RepID=A0A8R1E7J3_CAEJA
MQNFTKDAGCVQQHQEHHRQHQEHALSCPQLRVQLFDFTVLPALTYGPETISRNLITGTTPEESAQGRYPSTIGCPRSLVIMKKKVDQLYT